jgi:hypothetical protein
MGDAFENSVSYPVSRLSFDSFGRKYIDVLVLLQFIVIRLMIITRYCSPGGGRSTLRALIIASQMPLKTDLRCRTLGSLNDN